MNKITKSSLEDGINHMINSSINKNVILLLNDQRYFQSSAGTSVVPLVSKEEMMKIIGMDNSGWSDSYIDQQFRENDVKSLDFVQGICLRATENSVKIKPAQGEFTNPSAKYLLVNKSDILSLGYASLKK